MYINRRQAASSSLPVQGRIPESLFALIFNHLVRKRVVAIRFFRTQSQNSEFIVGPARNSRRVSRIATGLYSGKNFRQFRCREFSTEEPEIHSSIMESFLNRHRSTKDFQLIQS
jgi:hypothetical protein